MRDPTLHKYIRSPLTSESDRHQLDGGNPMHTTTHSAHNTHIHEHSPMHKRPGNIDPPPSPQPLHDLDKDNPMHTTHATHNTHNTHNDDHCDNSMRKRPENISRSSSPQPPHEQHRHGLDKGNPMYTTTHSTHSTHNTHTYDHYNNSMRKRPANIGRPSSPQPLHEQYRQNRAKSEQRNHRRVQEVMGVWVY